MPRVSQGGWKGGGPRLWAAVRGLPHTLREDLWTVARDPLPRMRWLGRLPHAHIVLFTVLMGWLNADRYKVDFGPSAGTAVLVLSVLQSGAAVLALSRPVPAWWVSTIALFLARNAGEFSVGHPPLWSWSIPGVALHALVLFLLALRVRPRLAAEVLGLSLLAGAAALVFAAPAPDPSLSPGSVPLDFAAALQEGSLAQDALIFTIAVVLGTALRGRRVARTQLVEQEVLTAEERARRTLLEERNRIARELHDVVAHHMSVISIQAQVAPHLVKDPTDELKENLAGIRGNAVEALTELRRVLGVLRSEDALADGVRHTPQPTLGRLDDLVGTVRGAGLRVTTEITGEPRPLSPGVELSAFRIVQEALSNAIRHAPGAEVRVAIGYRTGGLTLRVANSAPDGPAPPSQGAGHGLLGMHERTAMLGGELATGPTPDGGYEVTAILPAQAAKPDDPGEPAP
ncbi:sensor histidine kinase [Streptomyces sp. Je 1-4]|nr:MULTISPECIES: sensor histidine kinase [unclassified Streptomyces]UYB38196.1 sensor histidine kinase [Streptomyces sp. Je 1-4]UZQ34137.1 sensor histidine kinase [Streptomyces sp. Je 1-4] [Streptomyces sp. Je 1-4 4N24]UZQ41555.1 sensor histidine kinase [Streptomyces sp. Je 1-4] [Streptomyces sp. Je 1-4 4N24_ara]